LKLFNPSEEDIEFFYGGKPYSLGAGETAEFPDKVADHCLRFVNSPIVAAEQETTAAELPSVEAGTPDLESMNWNELRRFGKGTFVPGMKRAELIEALRNV